MLTSGGPESPLRPDAQGSMVEDDGAGAEASINKTARILLYASCCICYCIQRIPERKGLIHLFPVFRKLVQGQTPEVC